MLSCEYCKIFKNSFFIEHLRLLLLLMYFRRNIEKPRICFQICNFTKKRLQHKCFLVNIEKFLRTSILKKKTTTQVFSCEFCEIFKKSFFIEHLGDCFWCILDEKLKNLVPAFRTTILKEALIQFSCEYCEIFKNTYFEEHLRKTASYSLCSLNLIIINPFRINQFQLRATFHMETSHSIYCANQMTGFYLGCNTGWKWVNSYLIKGRPL